MAHSSPARPSRSGAVVTAAATALLLSLSACTSNGDTTSAASSGSSRVPSAGAGSGSPVAGGTLAQVPGLVRDVEPSVVTIFTRGGLGSGVVYRADGVIITNEHVVRGAEQVQVGFADGQRVPGEVVAADASTDLALVRTEREDLPVARFQTELPQVGELAIAMGSPLGFQNSVTAGIISGIGREVPGSAEQSQALVNLIQTDAAISPGNSGGALVNGAGEVVGINDAYIPPAAGAVSIGFAIPTATALDVAEQLLSSGQVRSPFVGVSPGRISAQVAERFGLTETEGVLVLQVVPGSPAEQAGVQPGDVLTQIGSERIRTVEQFLGALRTLDIGQTVPVTLVREDQSRTAQITLTERTR